MNYEFKISIVDWHPFDVPNRADAVTLADIAIYAGDVCLTELIDRDARTTRETVRASALQLALWLGSNYWRLRCETVPPPTKLSDLSWQMAHRLPSAAGGFKWPDLRISGLDGDIIWLETKLHEQQRLASVSYLRLFEGYVDAKSFTSATSSFIESVLIRLSEFGLKSTPLDQIWSEVQSEVTNKKASTFRRLEALLGLDPDEQPQLIERLLMEWVPIVGAQSVEEMAASSGWQSIEAVLTKTIDKAQKIQAHGKDSDLDAFRGEVPALNYSLDRPWLYAREAAYAVRKKANIGVGPVRENDFANILGVSMSNLSVIDRDLPFSFSVTDPSSGRFGYALARPRPESKRFDLARLLGDQLVFEQKEQIKPATGATTLRQKIQRAFAAEFLCPSTLVTERTSSSKTIDEVESALADIAFEYDVSEDIVVNHFRNHGSNLAYLPLSF